MLSRIARSISRAVRPSRAARLPVAAVQRSVAGARFFSTVPVTTAARTVSMKITNEEEAAKLDQLTADAMKEMKIPGVVKYNRKVCMNEWDYEVTLVFEDIAALKTYMSDYQPKMVDTDFYNALTSIAVDGEIKAQNFVFNEYQA